MDPTQGANVTIASLQLHHWRNIEQALLEPHPRWNVFHGENAQGKTNLLEAVYFLARLKSFREVRLAELVRHEASAAKLSAKVLRAEFPERIEIQVQGKKRAVSISGKPLQRVGEHCQHYKVVLFTPEDIYLARGTPGERRRFLDRALYNLEPSYLQVVTEYNRLLKQRNTLLRDELSDAQIDLALDSYDPLLAKAGAAMIHRRQTLVDELLGRVQRVWLSVFGDRATVSLSYKGSVRCSEGVDVEESLLSQLQSLRPRDRRRGATGVGPHLDDLQCLLDDAPFRSRGSQGQHRILVLAMKVSEIELVIERTGILPLLLLDDISSELDAQRNAQLFDYLDSVQGQVFLTTTDPRLVSARLDRYEFAVNAGELCKSS